MQEKFIANHVLMVRPRHFRSNEETLATNSFQSTDGDDLDPTCRAIAEFDGLKLALENNGIRVTMRSEPANADTPDALFPNNWFAVLPSQQVYIFPMMAINRRREIQTEWIREFSKDGQIIDLSNFAESGKFLEGTGSLILDHKNRRGYACLSQRTNPDVIAEFSNLSGYEMIQFRAHDHRSKPFYHTNVMLALGDSAAIICDESISDRHERRRVLDSLENSGKVVISISMAQVIQFAGNMLQLANIAGKKFWICSRTAAQSLSDKQRLLLEGDSTLVDAPLATIERYGGGSARCMLAEIF